MKHVQRKNITAFTAVYSLETSRGVINTTNSRRSSSFRHDEIIARTSECRQATVRYPDPIYFTGKNAAQRQRFSAFDLDLRFDLLLINRQHFAIGLL